MGTNRLMLLVAALVVAAGLLAACGDDDTPVEAGSDVSDDETTVDEGVPLDIDRGVLTTSTWVLRFGGGPDGEIPIVDGWPITITFTEDGSFGGTSACNGYGGSYSIDGSRLVLDEVSSTAMACEPDVNASEGAYQNALSDVDGINLVTGGETELALSGPATELIFGPTSPAPLDALVGQLWVLEALIRGGEETTPQGAPATLLVQADGSFVGSTGCRGLSGRWVLVGNEVLFNEMGADGNCPTSLSDQDGRVVTVLGDGFVPAIEGDTLTVTSAGNESLRYRATTEDELSGLSGQSAPSDAELLDGIEWRFVGGDSPAGPIADPTTIDPASSITLIFTDGAYEGTVVCNRYGGDADLSGTLWSFTLGVPSAEEEGCGDGLDEIAAAYLDALPQMNEGGVEEGGQALVMNGNEIELWFERAG